MVCSKKSGVPEPEAQDWRNRHDSNARVDPANLADEESGLANARHYLQTWAEDKCARAPGREVCAATLISSGRIFRTDEAWALALALEPGDAREIGLCALACLAEVTSDTADHLHDSIAQGSWIDGHLLFVWEVLCLGKLAKSRIGEAIIARYNVSDSWRLQRIVASRTVTK